jgi:hypothetical protein
MSLLDDALAQMETKDSDLMADWFGSGRPAEPPPKYLTVGNQTGPGTYGGVSVASIRDAMMNGTAKMVDVYPESFVNGNYWDTRYSTEPTGGAYLNENQEFVEQQPTKALMIAGRVYIPSNDWGITPVTETVGYETSPNPDDSGNYYNVPITREVPGRYLLRSRVDGNVIDNLAVAFDPATGDPTGVGANSYQTGSNRGNGGFMDSMVTGFQDLITSNPLIPIAAAVMMPTAGAYLAETMGVSQAAGTALASAAYQAAEGKNLQDIAKGTALTYAGSQVGNAVNQNVDAALSSGTGSVGDTAGNIAGRAAAGYVASEGKADPQALLEAGALGEGVGAIAAQVPGFSNLSASTQKSVLAAITATVQGQKPTAAIIRAALKVGKETADSAPQDDGTTEGIQDVINQIERAPRDDGTTEGIQDIIRQIETAPKDDGTTEGIQDVIDQLPPTQPAATPQELTDIVNPPAPATAETPATPPAEAPTEQVPANDGTTEGIQEVIDQIESAPRDDGTTEGINEVIAASPAQDTTPATTKPTAPTTAADVAAKPPAKSTTPAKASTAAATPAAASTDTDMASLLGLLGMMGGGQQTPQQPVQTPAAEVKSFADLGYGELFGPELKFADGGSIEDLLRLLGE